MWQPNEQDLHGLIQLLTTAQQGIATQQVFAQLESFNQLPEYNNYLAYIFALTNENSHLRMSAGIALKNNLKSRYDQVPPHVLEFCQHCVLKALVDDKNEISSTAGSIITTVLQTRVNRWPDVLQRLLELLSSQNPTHRMSAYRAMDKICEDSAEKLSDENSEYVKALLSTFVNATSDENPRIRGTALKCINQFLIIRADVLMSNLDAFLAKLYDRANDHDAYVRKYVCQAFVNVSEVAPNSLVNVLDSVVNFMLYCTQDKDQEVALEACDFWLVLAEQDDMQIHLQHYIPRLLPVLLNGMVYTEEDIMELGGFDDDDAHVPDQAQDIKPRHHKGRTHAPQSMENLTEAKSNEDDLEDEDDEDPAEKWNVRKCAASAIDVLATVYGDGILQELLPHINTQLFSEQWEHREAGILALGAIAEGCASGMEPHLPTIIPLLIKCFEDRKPLVRSITCWTLSRYASWICPPNPGPSDVYQEHLNTYFNPLLLGLMHMVLDNNKEVQKAGCSALATIEEEAGMQLVPFLDQLIQTLCTAFGKYQQEKNMMILYDAFGTLAETVNTYFAAPKYVNMYMPILLNKWSGMADDDRGLFPLLECLSSVAIAVGKGFQPYAPAIWERCIRIIRNTLVQIQAYRQDPTMDMPDKDFLITCVDLISGIIQGLASDAETYIEQTTPPFYQLMAACMQDSSPDVKTSTFALMGDLAMYCSNSLIPHLPQLLPLIINGMSPHTAHSWSSPNNNATWATGEIALKYQSGMEPWVQPILQQIIPVLLHPNTTQSLRENTAITIGRLGLVVPAQVAPHLSQFGAMWCQTMCRVHDNQEKASSFMGFCQLVMANPNAIAPHFQVFLEAALNTQGPEPLNQSIGRIIHSFSQAMGAHWQTARAGYPQHIQNRLRDRFGL
ncbi:armadillo-type protein [Gorgonomyces haynaldii]|nr:armadillo-type protein [Gorgonomyces haynaldii]